jgi:hypothetical protein
MNWRIKRGSEGGFIISHGAVTSCPIIRRWYLRPLYPWAVFLSALAVRDYEMTHV